MSVRLRPGARADLLSIHRYVAQHRPASADALLTRFAEVFDALADQPGMGRARLPSRPAIRVFPVGSYLVFYRPDPPGIVVVRVLHGARDWRRLMDDGAP